MALSVLIVDDSPVMRSFIRKVLGLTGLELGTCHEAGNGGEALRVLSQHTVDLVLTDINMPQMNGEELVRKLAADERLSNLPVIVISTDSSTCRVQQLLALGARGYMAKPFVPEDLYVEVQRVLGAVYA